MLIKPNKFLLFVICFILIFEQSGFAQTAAELNIASHLSAFHTPIISDKYRPLHLRYLQYLPQEDSFKLLLDKGDFVGEGLASFHNQNTKQEKLKQETNKLMQYFFIGLILPNETFWVNLRPDSPDNVIDDYLAKTDIGRIMLETDVQLKKDTARFTSPKTPEGRLYWDKLYKKAEELFGNENVTIPTLTRPWIVPGEIIIRETTDSAYIYKATLKVMLEEDYLKNVGEGLASSRNQNTNNLYEFKDPRAKQLNTYSTQLIKELIIPKLTKEVNTSKRYAELRQVYYSLILAQWFKQKAQRTENTVGAGLAPARLDNFYKNIINSNNLAGLISKQPWDKQTYFDEYQKSFKDGEYSIQEPVRTPTGQVIRSYFSGGEMLTLSKITAGSMLIHKLVHCKISS